MEPKEITEFRRLLELTVLDMRDGKSNESVLDLERYYKNNIKKTKIKECVDVMLLDIKQLWNTAPGMYKHTETTCGVLNKEKEAKLDKLRELTVFPVYEWFGVHNLDKIDKDISDLVITTCLYEYTLREVWEQAEELVWEIM